MINLSLHSCPVKKQEIVFQSMPPDTILLNLDNGYYYSTNSVGAAVWEHCDGRNSITEIMSKISNICGKRVDEIKEEIWDFIKDMVKEGLLQIEKD